MALAFQLALLRCRILASASAANAGGSEVVSRRALYLTRVLLIIDPQRTMG
jgi:hypothetical protein